MRWRVMLATCGSVTLFSLMAIASDKPPDPYVKQMRDMNDAAIMLQDDIEARKGCCGRRWRVAGGIRERPEEQSLSGLESDVAGLVLSAARTAGRDTEG